jgi:hypothetical protein
VYSAEDVCWWHLLDHVEGAIVSDRAIDVWLSITALARSEGAAVGVRHAVSACAKAIGAGAALSMSTSGGPHEPVFATDPRSDELEDLQATLGQGPSAEVIGGGGPVLEGELAGAEALARWPEFTPAALATGVGAVFAVPVGVGAARLGVLGLYRDQMGALSSDQFDTLLLYADAVLMLALDERGGLAPGTVDLVEEAFGQRRAEIHQAAGMVSVQLGVSLTDALVALRARAYAEGQTIAQVAADVIARRLSFSSPEFSLPEFGASVQKDPAAPSGDPSPPEPEQTADEEREGGE